MAKKAEETVLDVASIYQKVNGGNPIPVVHASLHQAIVWGPAGINTEKTLSATKTPGVKMYWCEHGLLLEKNGKTSIVPSANVAIAQLE
jgi:hypothetical protein